MLGVAESLPQLRLLHRAAGMSGDWGPPGRPDRLQLAIMGGGCNADNTLVLWGNAFVCRSRAANQRSEVAPSHPSFMVAGKTGGSKVVRWTPGNVYTGSFVTFPAPVSACPTLALISDMLPLGGNRRSVPKQTSPALPTLMRLCEEPCQGNLAGPSRGRVL
jgi:hypothetical protein